MSAPKVFLHNNKLAVWKSQSTEACYMGIKVQDTCNAIEAATAYALGDFLDKHEINGLAASEFKF